MSSRGIRFHFSSLETTSWREHVVRFAIGGAITAIAGMLAKEYGPSFGGLFLAFPAIFPCSATMLEKHERQEKQEKGFNPGRRGRDAAALDARGAALGSIGLIVFAWFVWKVLPNHSAWIIVIAGVLWFLTSFFLWLGRKSSFFVR